MQCSASSVFQFNNYKLITIKIKNAKVMKAHHGLNSSQEIVSAGISLIKNVLLIFDRVNCNAC